MFSLYIPKLKFMKIDFKNLLCIFFWLSDSSVGKDGEESACNAGDPGLIPWFGRFTGEGIGYLLQYSWASLVPQLVKNPPAMRETWVWSLGWEDSLEKGKGHPLQYSGLENSMDCICVVHGVAKSRTQLSDFHFQDSHSEGLHENGEKKKGYLRSDFQAEDWKCRRLKMPIGFF